MNLREPSGAGRDVRHLVAVDLLEHRDAICVAPVAEVVNSFPGLRRVRSPARTSRTKWMLASWARSDANVTRTNAHNLAWTSHTAEGGEGRDASGGEREQLVLVEGRLGEVGEERGLEIGVRETTSHDVIPRPACHARRVSNGVPRPGPSSRAYARSILGRKRHPNVTRNRTILCRLTLVARCSRAHAV